LDELFVLAQDIEPVGGAQVAACLVHKRAVVSYGFCQYKTHPLQSRFSSNEESTFLHAEIDAIAKAIQRMRSVDFLRSSTLYVARAKWNGPEKRKYIKGLACPCEGCAGAISAFKIPNVFYTKETCDERID
tara:strand:+ start:314 stop:706 length:393 start_codon:yes stop_codon:yes gene_type:complete